MTTGNVTMGPLLYGSGVTSGSRYYQNFWSGTDRGYSLKRYRPVKEYYTDSAGKRRYTITRIDTYQGLPPDTPHAFSRFVQSYDLSPGTYRYLSSGKWVYSPWSPRQAGLGFQYQNMVWNSNDDIALVNKLRSRMLGSDFDPGVFIAEFPKAAKLVVTTATRLVSAYSKARSGRFVAAARLLFPGGSADRLIKADMRKTQRRFELQALAQAKQSKLKPGENLIMGDVNIPHSRIAKLRKLHAKRRLEPVDENNPLTKQLASGWLELQYGWKPLLQDLKGGVEAAAHALETPLKKRYSASISKETKVWTMDCWCRIVGGGVVLLPQTFNGGVRKRIVAYVEETDVPSMSQMVDLTTIAWEVIPFSFVGDWVVPFGSYLSARAFAARTTGTFVHSLKYWVDGKDFLSPSANMQHSQASRFMNVAFTRTITSTLDVKLPVRKSMDKVFSATHIENAIALLRNMRN